MISINKKTIVLGNSEYMLIDLTQPLRLNIEVYPGDPKPERKVFSDIKDGCHHYIHSFGDHVFHPHADAPNHQNPELQDRGIDFFDLDYCFNKACLIDLSESSASKEFDGIRFLVEVKKEHLEPFSKMISDKSAVVIRTGYDKWLEANKPHVTDNLPYLSKEAAEFIESFENIKVIAIDSLTVDPPGSHVAHKILKNKLIVESLPFLFNIPVDSRQDFLLQTSPIRIEGATGAPVVAYAFIKK